MFKFCSAPYDTVNIHENGNVSSCLCGGWHSYGNDMGNLNKNSLIEIFANQNFETFRSSIVDQSFKYCRKDQCGKLWNLDQVDNLESVAQKKILPKSILLHIDRNCNLKCASCRNSIDWNKTINPKAKRILDVLIDDYNDYPEPVFIQCDGTGDIFASSAYLEFFSSNRLPRCFQFNLTTNGNLVTKNLDLLRKIKDQIFSICVSFDAGNEITYKNVRGGKYSLIVDGVKAMIDMGILRVNTSFVVQAKNYLEILDHYNFCKETGINHTGFSMIDRWGHMSNDWWQANQIDNNPEIDYDFLIPALKTIKATPKFNICGGLENLIASKSS